MNRYAAEFTRLSAEEAAGREWHTVIRNDSISGCCPLCKTRRALRRGEAAQPETIGLIAGDGSRRSVLVVPVPAGPNTSGNITFLIIDESVAHSFDLSEPVHATSAPSPVRQLEEDRIIEELTLRERQILSCVVDGLDARGIAAAVGISHATARNYVQRILTKLGVRNKAEAVRIALTYNLLAS